MKTRKPYDKRTDLEKIKSQWHKLTGLHSREEWSAAIVRAATVAEIAVNFAIRQEFKAKSKFDGDFVDKLLRWANGINYKIEKLLIPLTKKEKYGKTIKDLQKISENINKTRNEIIHQGEFCSEQEAKDVIGYSKEFVEALVRVYLPNFALKTKRP